MIYQKATGKDVRLVALALGGGNLRKVRVETCLLDCRLFDRVPLAKAEVRCNNCLCKHEDHHGRVAEQGKARRNSSAASRWQARLAKMTNPASNKVCGMAYCPAGAPPKLSRPDAISTSNIKATPMRVMGTGIRCFRVRISRID